MVNQKLIKNILFNKLYKPRWNVSIRNINSNFYNEVGDKIFINNKFAHPKSKETFKVFNPVVNSIIGSCPNSAIDETVDAIEAAYECFPKWAENNYTRSKLLRLLAAKLKQYKEQLANTITAEMGKPISQSMVEVESAIRQCQWYSEECERIQGEILLTGPNNKKQLTVKQPHGVVGLITPWNFPLSMIVRSMTAALAAGCTLVIKPAPETPFTALFLAKMIQECDFPNGAVNIVTSDAKCSPSVGYTLCKDIRVSHISFTGSSDVGKKLMGQAASSVKRVSMELGGNAPYIVFSDADIDHAVECLRHAKFRNTGQTCITANRIFVHKNILKEFVDKLKLMVSTLKSGLPINDETEISCLYSHKGYIKVDQLVEEALKGGAALEYKGPEMESLGKCYYPPTILSNINQSMPIANTEIFGPVCSIIPFESFSEVIKLANSTPYGLAAYSFVKDHNLIWKCIKSLDFGLLAINDSTPTTFALPFGGLKNSGVGSEMGSYGIKNYMDTKAVVIGLSDFT